MTRLQRVFHGRVLGSMCCVLALASTALLSSCTSGPVPLATINYTEASVCADNGGSPNTPENLIILVFEITSISNTASNAPAFTFDPNLLYVLGQNGHDYAATSQTAASGLSLTGAPFGFARTQTVPARATATVNAGVVATDTVDPNSSDISNKNTIDFHLLYSPPAGSEGVVLVKTNEGATRYPTVGSWGCPHNL
jgi:hypothetical protein